MANADWGSPREALNTLRRLPPGADPGPPDAPVSAALLREILDLPAATDVHDWLLHNRAETCVRIALAEELTALRSAYRAAAEGQRDAADQVERSRAERHVADLGDLGDDAAVAHAVAVLRHSGDAPALVSESALSLLTELLAAPGVEDPVTWLATNRSHLAVDRGARLLVYEVRAAHQDVGAVAQELRRNLPMINDPATGFAVQVRRVVVGNRAMSIESRATVPHRDREWAGSRHRPHLHRMLTWPGFTEVADDLGYRYLVTRSEPEPDNRGGELVRQVCFPSPYQPATRLRLSSSGYQSLMIQRDGAWTERPTLHVDAVAAPVVVEFPLPGEATADA